VRVAIVIAAVGARALGIGDVAHIDAARDDHALGPGLGGIAELGEPGFQAKSILENDGRIREGDAVAGHGLIFVRIAIGPDQCCQADIVSADLVNPIADDADGRDDFQLLRIGPGMCRNRGELGEPRRRCRGQACTNCTDKRLHGLGSMERGATIDRSE